MPHNLKNKKTTGFIFQVKEQKFEGFLHMHLLLKDNCNVPMWTMMIDEFVCIENLCQYRIWMAWFWTRLSRNLALEANSDLVMMIPTYHFLHILPEHCWEQEALWLQPSHRKYPPYLQDQKCNEEKNYRNILCRVQLLLRLRLQDGARIQFNIWAMGVGTPRWLVPGNLVKSMSSNIKKRLHFGLVFIHWDFVTLLLSK